MKNILKYSAGFTLIELAIVLVIIAILIGSFIGTLTVRIENTQIDETKNDLEEIKQALIGYAYTNGHLPCPDCINVLCSPGGFRNGIEDRTAGACNVGNSVGTLPWITLGLGRGDAWNTRYRYWVDDTYANNGAGNIFGVTSANGIGAIQEPDYIADPTGATLDNMALNVVAVVYSHGKNTLGGISSSDVLNPAIPAANVDEIENIDVDVPPIIFVSRPPSPEDATTAGGEFDDILMWLTDFELKAKMVEAGVLP